MMRTGAWIGGVVLSLAVLGGCGSSEDPACADPVPFCLTGILCGEPDLGGCSDPHIGVWCPGVPGRLVAGDCGTGEPRCIDVETREIVGGVPYCDTCGSNICPNDMR